MKTVTAHARVVELLRQPNQLGELGLRTMHGGIEARDLRQVRSLGQQGADRREVVRLVQRHQWHELFELGDHPRIDTNRRSKLGTPMNDPVTDLGLWALPVAVLGGAIRVGTPFLYVSLGECLTERAGR